MGSFTTAMPNSFKNELPQSVHCFTATATPTGNNTSGQFTWTSMSSVAGLVVGMAVTGTNVAANSVIASIDSATQITLSKVSTSGPNTGVTLTCAGDVFKIALGIQAPTGVYGTGTTNYANLTTNSDEVTGTGYVAGGVAMTANQTPTNSTTQTFWQWSSNPSWGPGATISCNGCIIYNTNGRLGNSTFANSANRAAYVGLLGNQSVTAGTLTLIQPANGGGTALLQLN